MCDPPCDDDAEPTLTLVSQSTAVAGATCGRAMGAEKGDVLAAFGASAARRARAAIAPAITADAFTGRVAAAAAAAAAAAEEAFCAVLLPLMFAMALAVVLTVTAAPVAGRATAEGTLTCVVVVADGAEAATRGCGGGLAAASVALSAAPPTEGAAAATAAAAAAARVDGLELGDADAVPLPPPLPFAASLGELPALAVAPPDIGAAAVPARSTFTSRPRREAEM